MTIVAVLPKLAVFFMITVPLVVALAILGEFDCRRLLGTVGAGQEVLVLGGSIMVGCLWLIPTSIGDPILTNKPTGCGSKAFALMLGKR